MGFFEQAIKAVPVLGTVASGLIDSNTAKRNTDKTIQANKALAEYQYSRDIEMWNKSNQYNTPAMQMQRFKNAGLNPNLIYGQGNAGNTASTLPKYQAPTVRYDYKPPIDPQAILSNFQDFTQRSAVIDNLHKQNDGITLENDKKKITNDILEEEKKRKVWENNNIWYDERYNKYLFGKSLLQDAQNKAVIGNYQRTKARIEAENASTLMKLKINGLQQNINESIQRVKQSKSTVDSQIKLRELYDLRKTFMNLEILLKQQDVNWAPWMRGSQLLGNVIGGALNLTGVGKGIKSLQSAPTPEFKPYWSSSTR